MKEMRKLIGYHSKLFRMSNKWIMPLLLWIASMFISYSVMPVDVGSSILVSATTLFYIMLWLGIAYYDSVSPVAEQIVITKVKKRWHYDRSQMVFLFILTLLFSCIGVIYPVVFNLMHNGNLYTRALQSFDILSSAVIHICFATLGLAISMLLQPRVIKNRKVAILFIACIAILAICKPGIISSVSITKYILWILPPLSDSLGILGKSDIFRGVDLLCVVGMTCLYDIVLTGLSEVLLKRRNNY